MVNLLNVSIIALKRSATRVVMRVTSCCAAAADQSTTMRRLVCTIHAALLEVLKSLSHAVLVDIIAIGSRHLQLGLAYLSDRCRHKTFAA